MNKTLLFIGLAVLSGVTVSAPLTEAPSTKTELTTTEAAKAVTEADLSRKERQVTPVVTMKMEEEKEGATTQAPPGDATTPKRERRQVVKEPSEAEVTEKAEQEAGVNKPTATGSPASAGCTDGPASRRRRQSPPQIPATMPPQRLQPRPATTTRPNPHTTTTRPNPHTTTTHMPVMVTPKRERRQAAGGETKEKEPAPAGEVKEVEEKETTGGATSIPVMMPPTTPPHSR